MKCMFRGGEFGSFLAILFAFHVRGWMVRTKYVGSDCGVSGLPRSSAFIQGRLTIVLYQVKLSSFVFSRRSREGGIDK